MSMVGKRNKGKIFQYSIASLVKAIDAVQNGRMSVLRASVIYKVPRTTLREKLKGNAPVNLRKVGPECKLGNKVEEKLVNWILSMASRGFPVDKDGLLCSVRKLIKEANLAENFGSDAPGKKWLTLFLKRHPIISQKHAEYVTKARAMVTEENIRKWFDETTKLLGEDIDVLNFPARIWNMDETAIFLSPKGSLILAERGKSCYDVTSTSEKENITTLITANAEGTLAPPLTIFKYDRLPAIIPKSAPSGWGIGKSDSGWMQSDTFFEYFANVFVPYLQRENYTFPIIVFIDGHKSHLSLHLSLFCREHKIILISLYPNTTHIMQPLDIAFFFPLKQAWKKIVKKWMLDHDGQTVQKKDVPAVLNEILTKNDFKSSLISGFKRSGLYPFNADAVDYSKCLNKSKQLLSIEDSNLTTDNDEQTMILRHLNFIESRFEEHILKQFNQTFLDNSEFSGETSYLELYRFWYGIKNSLRNGPNKIISQPADNSLIDSVYSAHDNDMLEFPFPEFDMLPDVETNNNGIFQEQLTHEIINEQLASLTSEETLQTIENENQNNEKSAEDDNEKVQHNEKNEQSLPSDETFLKSTNHDNEQSLSSNETTQNTRLSTENKIHVLQNIIINPRKRSTEEIFESVVVWPELTSNNKKNKKKREHLPSVLTSDKWLEVVEAKDNEKKRVEEEKAQKKIKREQAKKEKCEKKEKAEQEKSRKRAEREQAREQKNAAMGKRDEKAPTKQTESMETSLVVNAFVILKYDDQYYPAKILKVKKDYVFCSAMHRSGMNWKWPEKKADTLWYSYDDLIEVISPPTNINTRGMYTVPEIDKYM